MVLLLFVTLTFVAALVGNCFRPDAWFRALAKPDWNPPNWLFAPVWTVLYLCIAAAGWIVWRDAGADRDALLIVWSLQMLANALWTWLFFGRHAILAALVDICLLTVLIGTFILMAWKPAPIAALLFAPYLLWVAFATALNTAIYRLNDTHR